jgi:hypothetical protein
MTPPAHDPANSRQRIEHAFAVFPALAEKISRALMVALHSRGVVTIDEIYAEARRRIGRPLEHAAESAKDDNVQLAHRWDELERAEIEKVTLERAAETLSPDEIDDLVNLTRKREEAQSLEEIANLSQVSFRLLAEAVHRFCRLPEGQTAIPEWESLGVRVALTRHFISDQLEFIRVAKNYFRIRDFEGLIDRIVGDDHGMGRIGGKAAGIMLAGLVLERARQDDPHAPKLPIHLPESYFLRSDAIEQYMDHNQLKEFLGQKYKPIDTIRQEYPVVLNLFKNGQFPGHILDRLRKLLERVGPSPLIVRSSSLLEDRFGASFAGKYRSVFLANQGPIEQRLAQLTGAIAEVYASIFAPDPISYRRRHDLIDYDDSMAVLIQKVVGRRYGPYLLPNWAGVAFSRNEYRWSPRIQRDDGLARIVFGLGTRAVDRVASDYPRMVALGLPTLRPVASAAEIRRYSQRHVDVINIEKDRFETVSFVDLLQHGAFSGLDQVVSIDTDFEIRKPTTSRIDRPPSKLVLTFDRWASESEIPALLRWILTTLERSYGVPMDIEFAFDGERFYLLQARPQAWHEEEVAVRVPRNVPSDRRVFSASRNVQNGSVHGIDVVVLVDPRDYDQLPSMQDRQRVAHAVGLLNERLRERTFVLMGPGRWGSNDMRLGVKVGYADINNARMLVEIARLKGGQVPEVSFGTHFFQDLVESDIRYLPLYPDDAGTDFNDAFLRDHHNLFAELVPELADLAPVIKVVDVPRASGGLVLNVDMDGGNQEALGYLAPPA